MLRVEDTFELNLNRRRLEVAALQSGAAKDELARAWDALRFDVTSEASSKTSTDALYTGIVIRKA
jgi:hypothetical protein